MCDYMLMPAQNEVKYLAYILKGKKHGRNEISINYSKSARNGFAHGSQIEIIPC